MKMQKEITIDTEYTVRITGKVKDDNKNFLPLNRIIENTDPLKFKNLIEKNIDSEFQVDVSASKRVVEETKIDD